MPALVLKPHEVLDALHEQAVHYANPSTMSPDAVPKPSLLVQTFEPYELGLVLPIVGAVSGSRSSLGGGKHGAWSFRGSSSGSRFSSRS